MDVEQHYRDPRTPANAAAPYWPARTQRLIAAVAPVCAQWLEPALRRCLEHFDKALYQHAEHSRGQQEQQQCFDTRALMKQRRAAFMQAFADQVRADFAGLGRSTEDEEELALSNQPLRLLERGEQETAAVLAKLAARGEARHRTPLTQLAYRYAVLVGTPPLEGAALPVGPASLAAALRAGMTTVELLQDHRLLLVQSFEQIVIGEIGTLYDRVNDALAMEGLLPRLRPYVATRLPGTARPAAWGGSEAPEAETEAVNGPADAATDAMLAGDAVSAAAAPITVMENLRELLASRRSGNPGMDGGPAATPGELQAALGALQDHLAQVSDQASRELRSAQRLRDELLLQLNANKPAGAPRTQLSPEQDDTVELMASLFEQIGQQMQHGPHAQSVLSGLQLPMLRLAVSDHEFLERSEHPGRRLLGAVAEAANDWLDGPDGDSDRQLTDRLQQLVGRAQKEPATAGLYTSLLADIEHQLAVLNRRAQAAERRHVEAMQGREKLDQARQRANELLAERFGTNPPRGLLRALLDRAWSDVLSLTLLQHGEDSTIFVQRMHVTDQLLGREPVTDTAWLRHEVLAGLTQIGMDSEESSQVAQRLIGSDATAAPSPATPATAHVASQAAREPAAATAGVTAGRPGAATTKAPTAPVAAPRTPTTAPTATVAPVSSVVAEPAPTTRPTTSGTVPRPAAQVPTTPAAPTATATAAPATAVAPATAPHPEPAAPTAATDSRSAAAATARSAAPANPPRATPAPAAAAATPPGNSLPSATDLAMRLKQRKRLGESASSTAGDDEPERPLGPQEARVYNRLRQLPYGTWFEFTDAKTGEVVQRKLAWFSPITGNSLFVTRRGQRGEEINLRELARGIVYRQVREMPKQRDNLLDRAWHSLAGNLRRGGSERRTTGER